MVSEFKLFITGNGSNTGKVKSVPKESQ